ncbi:MAG: hypothetical protein V3R99_11505 [Thermoguttaceae bacterium]
MNDESVVSERRPSDNPFRGWIIRRAALIGILLCTILGLRAYVLWIPQVPFDPPTWRGDEARARGDYKIPDGRETMMRDLLTNHLPGMNRQQIKEILGSSHTHETARIRESGTSYFFQSYEWDMLYPLSVEATFILDHRGKLWPEQEYLFIRLGKDGLFESWYIYGSERWPKIVGREAASCYRTRR